MIYQLVIQSSLAFTNSDNYAILKTWKNPQRIESWREVQVKLQDGYILQDVMGLHSIVVWSQSVHGEVSLLAGASYQALPISVDRVTVYAIHITQALDCIDKAQSQFKRFKNRNIGVETIVLRESCVGNTHLFTIPDDGYSAIFVSEAFKALVENHHWEQIKFIPVDTTLD